MREAGRGEAPFVGPWTGRSEGDFDASCTDFHERAELQEFQPDRAAGFGGELRMGEADAA